MVPGEGLRPRALSPWVRTPAAVRPRPRPVLRAVRGLRRAGGDGALHPRDVRMSLWEIAGLVAAGLVLIWAAYRVVRGMDLSLFERDD